MARQYKESRLKLNFVTRKDHLRKDW